MIEVETVYQSPRLVYTVKPAKTATLKKTKNGFQDQLLLNAGQKYSKLLQREHSAILLTFIRQQVDIKTSVLSIFKWPFYTCFIVFHVLILTSF